MRVTTDTNGRAVVVIDDSDKQATPAPHRCECPAAGHCPRHGFEKNGRQWQLCRGENCTPQQQARFVARWEARRDPRQQRVPALSRRVLTFLWGLLRWAGDLFRSATDEVYRQRLQMCRACPDNKFDGTHCTECGCPIRKKARRRSESCPLGHWPDSHLYDGVTVTAGPNGSTITRYKNDRRCGCHSKIPRHP